MEALLRNRLLRLASLGDFGLAISQGLLDGPDAPICTRNSSASGLVEISAMQRGTKYGRNQLRRLAQWKDFGPWCPSRTCWWSLQSRMLAFEIRYSDSRPLQPVKNVITVWNHEFAQEKGMILRDIRKSRVRFTTKPCKSKHILKIY